jgi:hypothetical protein
MWKRLYVNYSLFLSGFNKTWIFSTNFWKKKSLNIKFHQSPVGVELFHADGQTNMTKLIVSFRNFAHAPESYDIIQQKRWQVADSAHKNGPDGGSPKFHAEAETVLIFANSMKTIACPDVTVSSSTQPRAWHSLPLPTEFWVKKVVFSAPSYCSHLQNFIHRRRFAQNKFGLCK